MPFKSAMFNLTAKITGQRYTRSISSLPPVKPIPRDRAPDWVAEEQTSTSQALIYRLSGDYNPLHVGAQLSHFIYADHLRQLTAKRSGSEQQRDFTRPFNTWVRRTCVGAHGWTWKALVAALSQCEVHCPSCTRRRARDERVERWCRTRWGKRNRFRSQKYQNWQSAQLLYL